MSKETEGTRVGGQADVRGADSPQQERVERVGGQADVREAVSVEKELEDNQAIRGGPQETRSQNS